MFGRNPSLVKYNLVESYCTRDGLFSSWTNEQPTIRFHVDLSYGCTGDVSHFDPVDTSGEKMEKGHIDTMNVL